MSDELRVLRRRHFSLVSRLLSQSGDKDEVAARAFYPAFDASKYQHCPGSLCWILELPYSTCKRQWLATGINYDHISHI